ncbi:MAG: zinc ABC transporter ATP-binding protein ZnuC [Rhodospirillaceae bacterium]|nr:zinc ABC transporter ATP-binding protein ZnuC [Rhodospirillaceae bacterium]
MPGNTDTGVLVKAIDINVSYGGRSVLHKAGAEVRAGEIVNLIGPNGAGKTTLVRALLGLLEPAGGTVVRRPGLKIGYMPQRLVIDPALPLTVNRFLALGIPRHAAGLGRRRAVLEETGAGQVADSPIQDISGGEMQRVLLARALLRDPDLLVLDEPVQGVDLGGQSELYAIIRHIRDDRGCGVLMVSHDLHVVMAATDHVICLNNHICCAGHPVTVSRHPEFVALFGPTVAAELSVYHHEHDHEHDIHGSVVPLHEDGGGNHHD